MRETAKRVTYPVGSLAQRWEELHQTSATLAALADLAPERYDAELAAMPAMLGEATEWQRELAWQGLEDIDAMMRPGLAALSRLEGNGQDATAPALALWREFFNARGAVMSVIAPSHGGAA